MHYAYRTLKRYKMNVENFVRIVEFFRKFKKSPKKPIRSFWGCCCLCLSVYSHTILMSLHRYGLNKIKNRSGKYRSNNAILNPLHIQDFNMVQKDYTNFRSNRKDSNWEKSPKIATFRSLLGYFWLPFSKPTDTTLNPLHIKDSNMMKEGYGIFRLNRFDGFWKKNEEVQNRLFWV